MIVTLKRPMPRTAILFQLQHLLHLTQVERAAGLYLTKILPDEYCSLILGDGKEQVKKGKQLTLENFPSLYGMEKDEAAIRTISEPVEILALRKPRLLIHVDYPLIVIVTH